MKATKPTGLLRGYEGPRPTPSALREQLARLGNHYEQIIERAAAKMKEVLRLRRVLVTSDEYRWLLGIVFTMDRTRVVLAIPTQRSAEELYREPALYLRGPEPAPHIEDVWDLTEKFSALLPRAKRETDAMAETPEDYVCAGCGIYHCKLWRDYDEAGRGDFRLLCAECAADDQGKDVTGIDDQGRWDPRKNRDLTNQIGFCVPAMPHAEMKGAYWPNEAEVPAATAQWWRDLPTLPGKV